MTERDTTPTDSDLLDFDRGLLPDAAADAVARWLETQPEGDERLRRLVEQNPDDAMAALRGSCGIDAEMDSLSGAASRVMDRVLASTSAPAAEAPAAIREYRLLGPLGQGGMGRVYRARHTRLQRDVAIKLLPDHLASDPAFRARFEREMALIGQMDHPNLVRAYDAGAEGRHLFLVMELLDGLDLSRVLARTGPLSVADACEAVRQAAAGLHHAHEHGTVHRDVKPGNLFLTRAGVVKVIDLGLARAGDTRGPADPESSIRTVMGTPEYIAPEQWERPGADPRVDVYSLGCTLFCLLTGRPPFVAKEGDSWIVLLDAHRQKRPPALRERRPDVPPRLAELVTRMLAKSPNDRPASAQAVAKALAPFDAGHNLAGLVGGSSDRPSSPTPLGLTRPSRARFRWPVLAGAVVGLAALGLVIRSWLTHNPPPAPVDQAGPLILHAAHTLAKHTDRAVGVAFSPKGEFLASGSGDHTIWLWDTRTWETHGRLQGHLDEIVGLAFSPDGHTLASVGTGKEDCTIRLWDVATARALEPLGGETAGNFAVAYSPDGRTLACGGWDKFVRLFDVPTGQERHVTADAAPRFVRVLSFSPDGRQIVSGGNGPAKLWDAATGKEVPSQFPSWLNPTFLPNGKELACWTFAAGRVTIWDLPSGKKIRDWRAHPGNIEGMAVSPDGRFVLSVGADGGKLWSLADGSELARLEGHRGMVYAGCFSPDGRQVATTGAEDFTVRIWDLPEMFHVQRDGRAGR